ncbi:hypothetical protein [Catenulispora rubra]|uniref:hypothetical protein n=1 Tax=Catenulispora rubra TaxID=280293 RepID=UPI001892782C|nr:hypothetical protein [Catenulispora rubra]
MNATPAGTAAAATFTWLGMVLAISFLETPLKFRAPGVTIPIGVGIGRLVFRALNFAEAAFALVVIIGIAIAGPPAAVAVLTTAAGVLLTVQVAVVRPALNRRSDRVLRGEDLPRSRGHLWYVALEIAKVLILVALGISVLGASSH